MRQQSLSNERSGRLPSPPPSCGSNFQGWSYTSLNCLGRTQIGCGLTHQTQLLSMQICACVLRLASRQTPSRAQRALRGSDRSTRISGKRSIPTSFIRARRATRGTHCLTYMYQLSELRASLFQPAVPCPGMHNHCSVV